MIWRTSILAAALGLSLGIAAHAQAPFLEWTDPAKPGPTSGDSITKGLEDAGRKIASYGDQGVRAVYFDFVYPTAPDEYRALGANGVLLVSAVAHDAREFPMKRVYLHVGGRDIALERISSRQSDLPPASSLAKTVGVHRDDEFFLLPGVLAGQKLELLIDFGANSKGFKAGQLSLALPGSLRPAAKPPGPPDQAMLRTFLAREYPDLISR